jgi:hypothetical protein
MNAFQRQAIKAANQRVRQQFREMQQRSIRIAREEFEERRRRHQRDQQRALLDSWRRGRRQPDPPADDLWRPVRRGVSALRRLVRAAVCFFILCVLRAVANHLANAARWGRLSPQDATGLYTLISAAAAVVAVVLIYNLVRMIFRILANLLS